MDRARLSASRCPYFSSGQTIVLQPGRFMGRRAPPRMAGGRSALTRQLSRGVFSNSYAILARYDFLGVVFGEGGAAGLGAFAEPAGAGVGAGFASSSSTSKIRVELAPRSGLTALSPYARLAGINNSYFDPTFISSSASVQPLITPFTGNVAGWPRLYELSNSVPLINVPR